MISVSSALSALQRLLPHGPAAASSKTKPIEERQQVAAIQFEGECSYMAFRRFLFKAAYPNTDDEVLTTPSLLIERDSDIQGRGKIHVEASTMQTICDLPESTARLISVKDVLGIIYNSRDGSSRVFWREPRKIWGHASPRTFAMLLNCKARITSIIASPCTKPRV